MFEDDAVRNKNSKIFTPRKEKEKRRGRKEATR